MKKIAFYVMMLFMTVALPATLVSCSDDDDDGGGGTVPPAEQKANLESTANELMNRISASDFEEITDLIEYVDESTYDDGIVEHWFDVSVNSCEIYSSDSRCEYIYSAANFTGVFALQDGRWVQLNNNVDYLEFQFKSRNGENCVLKVTRSGKETLVHHEEFDSWDYEYTGDYYDSWDNWVPGSYKETYEINSIYIPENINVELKKGGSTLASSTIHTSVNLANGSEFDHRTDNLDITSNLKVKNYEIIVERLNYQNGKSAAVSAKFNKAGETLMSISATADGDLSNEENLRGSVRNINFDILGMTQIKGQITDINAMNAKLDEAEDNEDNEHVYKSCIDAANNYLDMGLYFNGSGDKSAYIKLYPFYDEYDSYYWNGSTYVPRTYGYWDYEAVMMFPDGSAHSTLEDYFEQNFSESVINRFENLVNDFENLVEDEEDYYYPYY